MIEIEAIKLDNNYIATAYVHVRVLYGYEFLCCLCWVCFHAIMLVVLIPFECFFKRKLASAFTVDKILDLEEYCLAALKDLKSIFFLAAH